jgi:hypothetical protein
MKPIVIPNEAEPNDIVVASSILEAKLRNRFEKWYLASKYRFLDFPFGKLRMTPNYKNLL